MEPVKIEITEAAIKAMTTDEKLSTLISIAFSNAEMLCAQKKILFGNGQEGLIDIARFHGRSLKGLWCVVTTAIIGFASVLFTYMLAH